MERQLGRRALRRTEHRKFALPKNFVEVETEFSIGSYKGNLFVKRLSDDLAVERIPMVQRQIEQPERVICRERKNTDFKIV